MINVNTIQSVARAVAQNAVMQDRLIYSSEVNTTDTTTTTIQTVTPQDYSAGVIVVMCAGFDGAEGVTGIKTARFIKVAGAITLGTVTSLLATEADTGLAGADFNIVVSGSDLLIQVTGVASTSINWIAEYKLINVVKEGLE